MTNVLILGASGQVARWVIQGLGLSVRRHGRQN
jgi:hypothetical protein